MPHNTVIVWGCGKVASILFEQIKRDKDNLSPDLLRLIPEVSYFVDSDRNKQGKYFYGKEVKPISTLECVEGDCTIVIAMLNHYGVLSLIKEQYGEKFTDVISSGEFIERIHAQIVKNADVLVREDYINDKQIAYGMIVGRAKYCSSDQRLTDGAVREIINDIGVAGFISGLVYVFSNSINSVLQDSLTWNYPQKEHYEKNIGLVSGSLSIGGAERVVSIHSGLFVQMGYGVTIINEYKYDTEYMVPDKVNRIIIQSPKQSIEYYDEYIKIIEKKHIDTICIHTPYEGAQYFYLVILFKLLGIRIITQFHTSISNFLRRWPSLLEHESIYKMCDSLVTLSENDANHMKKRGVNSVYIPNPVSDDLNLPSRNNHVIRNRILWAGRIDQQVKRVRDAVIIMKEVVKSFPDSKLCIVGRPSNEGEMGALTSEIHDSDMSESIYVDGFTSDMHAYYDNSDILLMTSPGEGFPMVLLEAKAHSIPTVMYELPDLELSREERGIISVRQGDTSGAASMIVKLLSDKGLYVKKSIEAWDDAQRFINYDIKSAWNRVLCGEQ